MILTYYNNPNNIRYFDGGVSPYEQIYLLAAASDGDPNRLYDQIVNYPQDSDVFLPGFDQEANSANNVYRRKYYSSDRNQQEDKRLDDFKEYKIRKGDSLSKIAARHGMSPTMWKKLAEINGLDNPNLIKAGDSLYIPKDWNIIQRKKIAKPQNANNVRVQTNRNVQISKPDNVKSNNSNILNNVSVLKPTYKKVSTSNAYGSDLSDYDPFFTSIPNYRIESANTRSDIEEFLQRNTDGNYRLANQQPYNTRNGYRDVLLSLINSPFSNINKHYNNDLYLQASKIKHTNKKKK